MAEKSHRPESNMSLGACLPTELRGPATTITRMAAGLSRAGVHRVEANGRAFALKIAGEAFSLDAWRRALLIQQFAASAGLAPPIVHTDESRRAVVSEFVTDRSFPAFLGNPRTREAAITLLGRTLRRVHELPLPADADARDPAVQLTGLWSALTGFRVPDFVRDAVQRVLSAEAPAAGHAVLSHNDVNPSNLLYDGERILLVDWETAGANDPFYDLAAISVFARMSEGDCRQMLTAHDGKPVAELPARFVYDRRLVAALGGAMFMTLARRRGHAGGNGSETLETALSLSEFYQQMRAGALNIATADGQWSFGLALARESAAI
jgi:aminoglycoside phosphotransferase (APT) family kinase protein